ncbi:MULTISPECIES: TonB family protein [unclassified Gilliamella]|uniref:TonB family protein n=1 Tax=unclassified Gilliamella TaxID=2685620 RepID=UPI0013088812|nr:MULTISPECIES: TonB family protein [unclassified Gilliamella]MWP48398.1 TonB family protein [Gilliamella sp. Lep-s35]MWP68323.1 TonB family protein [Gilliamella sp. Lep-s5]MWP76538.1 TonB family protein [Gilliamella sp. Lep-s21]
MKINFDIDIDHTKAPQSPAKKKQENTYLCTSASVLSHLVLLVMLFSSALLAQNIAVDEGDNSIKAVMVDLSLLAAPEQSLVENTPGIQGAEDSSIIDNQQIEEIPTQPEVVKEETPDPIIEKVIDKPTLDSDKKIEIKKEPKPKKKRRPVQKASHRQMRQEVNSQNIANSSVAPKISDNRQYSANPSPIKRNQPEYPRRALDMRIEGYVVAQFDVNSNGRVENIRIIEAIPNNIFNRSVISAMKTWKYQPIAAKDMKIKIIFNRDKSIRLE